MLQYVNAPILYAHGHLNIIIYLHECERVCLCVRVSVCVLVCIYIGMCANCVHTYLYISLAYKIIYCHNNYYYFDIIINLLGIRSLCTLALSFDIYFTRKYRIYA